jgi:Tol biopolymer transport system component
MVWASDSRILYALPEPPPNHRSANLWQIRIDQNTGEPKGEPERLTNWVGYTLSDFTVTADAKRFVLLKKQNQTDVYVARLEDGGLRLGAPRRLTLEDWNESPAGWTPDSRAVLYVSDRNANLDIFKQALDGSTAEAVATSPDDESEPVLTPDGAWILYRAGLRGPRRLMRVPAGGGPAEQVPSAARGIPSGVLCPSKGMRPCLQGWLLPEVEPIEPKMGLRLSLVLSAFDPLQGNVKELARIKNLQRGLRDWTLSHDGTRVAVLEFQEQKGRIRILDLDNMAERLLPLDERRDFQSLQWSADGRNFFGTVLDAGGDVLVRLDLQGRAQALWQSPSDRAYRPLPSPDGRYLALPVTSYGGNAWLLERF